MHGTRALCRVTPAPLPHSPMPLSCVTPAAPAAQSRTARHFKTALPCIDTARFSARNACPLPRDTRAPAAQPHALVTCDPQPYRARRATPSRRPPLLHHTTPMPRVTPAAPAAQPHAPVMRDPQPYRARRTTPSRRPPLLHHTTPMPLSCVTPAAPAAQSRTARHFKTALHRPAWIPRAFSARNARPLPRDTRGLPHSPMPLSCVTRSPTGRDARPRHAGPRSSIIRPLCPCHV